MEAIKEIRLGNKKLSIYQDENAEDPREWDNLSTMACVHIRYTLGDKIDFSFRNYTTWAEAKEALIKQFKVVVILPLYMYEHSGITIKTTPFDCRFDSGQIGFIFVTREKLLKEFSVKRLTKKHLDSATKTMLSEVETYDQFITGDVYWFKLVEIIMCDKGHEHEEDIDSCGGFFGTNWKENGLSSYITDEAISKLVEA